MQQRRLAAIMFTDIVGYTTLMGKDEKKAFDTLKKNRRIHWRLIKKYKGRWLKEMGDGILASFPSNIDAVLCAVSIQKAAEEMDIPLRIGIHQGDVIFEKKDVLGDGVNIASRIQGIAGTNDIVISETVFNDIKNKEGLEIDFLGKHALRGLESETNIYKVNCKDSTVLDFTIETGELIRPLGPGIKTIFAGIAILILLAFSLYYFLPKIIQPQPELEKSIAVLPFKSLSDDPEKQYLADGVMDAILIHLSKIEDLQVRSRSSVEKYRNPTKTVSEIAGEINANYILEGSFQKYGDTARLTVQLINAIKDDHVWANEYSRNWSDIFAVQSEVAQKIANELHVKITTEEREIIERIPTSSLTAYDYFLQAESELLKFTLFPGIHANSGRNALSLYNQVLKYDSSFAKVYARLAVLYYYFDYGITYFKDTYMDSMLTLANIALSYDDKCPDAYEMKGQYYFLRGNKDRGLQEFDKAINADPNFAMAYKSKGAYNLNSDGDVIVSFKNLYKALELEYGPMKRDILNYLADAYKSVEIFDQSDKYRIERLKFLEQDSMWYYHYYSNREETFRNIDKAIFWEKKALDQSPSSLTYTLRLGYLYALNKQYDSAYTCYNTFEKPLRNWSARAIGNNWIWYGFTLWYMGNQQDAKFWLDKALSYNIKSIELKRARTINFFAHYELARIYALLGNTEKTYYYLDQYNTKVFYPYSEIIQIKTDPFFNYIRGEERFQAITRNMEEKYRKERERVRIWLEEKNML